MEIFSWFETSALGDWVRLSVWAWPMLLTVHAIGLGLMVGIIWAMNLCVLVGAQLPLAALDKLMPVAWIGLALNALSGFMILSADTIVYVTSTAFQLKLLCIALGLINLAVLRRLVLDHPTPVAGDAMTSRRNRFLAGSSIALWLGAIVAGRLIAYTTSTF